MNTVGHFNIYPVVTLIFRFFGKYGEALKMGEKKNLQKLVAKEEVQGESEAGTMVQNFAAFERIYLEFFFFFFISNFILACPLGK